MCTVVAFVHFKMLILVDIVAHHLGIFCIQPNFMWIYTFVLLESMILGPFD
jgi:hypothetical protein